MKTSFRNPFFSAQSLPSLLSCSAFTIAISALLNPAHGAALTWDTVAGDAPAVTPGSGTWNTTSIAWLSSSNVAWSQTNTTTPVDRAIFGGADAAADTYVITLASQIAASGLKVNSSGYKLDGTGTLYLRNTSATGTGTFDIVDGKTFSIASTISGPTQATYWLAGEDATVNMNGNSNASLQPQFFGKSGIGTQGTFNFSGAYTYGVALVNARVNVIDNGNFTSTSSLFIGRGGQPAVGSNTNNTWTSSTGTLTLNGAGAELNHNSSNNTNHTMIGRNGGTGTLVIKNGTFNTATSSSSHDLAIVQDNTSFSTGTFDVQGGTVNIGSTTNNTAKINFGRLGLQSNQSATMTQSGGTINSHGGILFGGTTAGTYTGTATWTMTGGNLYLGAGGISEGTLSASENITLSGGTIGTLASWTGSLPMTLATTNGDLTFQAADSSSNPFDISLTNELSGSGGLKKTGGGQLILSGTNSYTGTTAVNVGTLRVNGSTHSSSAFTVASGATLAGAGNVAGTVAVSGNLAPGDGTTAIGTLNAGSTTWNGGTNLFQFDLATTSGSSDKLVIAGDFTKGAEGAYKFDFLGSAPATFGNVYDLVTWTGSTTFDDGDFTSQGLTGNFNTGTFSITNNTLQFTAIPEASNLLIGGLLGLGLMSRRRKQA